jgi:DNA modification methylase
MKTYKNKTIAVSELTEYSANARTHSNEQVQQICASIERFGFTNPILVTPSNMVIAGHGRLAAAQFLGIKNVPCIVIDGLTDVEIRAYIIADNKIQENGGWNEELLISEINNIRLNDFDLSLLGFSEKELSQLVIDDFDIEEISPVKEYEQKKQSEQPVFNEDIVQEPPQEPITKRGDIWILGNHRLMCGDSTSQDDVAKLMDGQKADMVFTDPPYNIDYQGVKDKREKIKNDKMDDAAFKDFLTQSLYSCETMYVCCSWQYSHLFKEAMETIGRKPKAMIVWDKVNPAQNLDKYYKQHELIYYYGDFGGHKTLRGDVWTLKRQKNTVHPTMKPVELIQLALEDQVGKHIVLDVFGGSGSTLIACEKLGRKARLMELDPKYCDVIVNRWENYTGKKAYLHENP